MRRQKQAQCRRWQRLRQRQTLRRRKAHRKPRSKRQARRRGRRRERQKRQREETKRLRPRRTRRMRKQRLPRPWMQVAPPCGNRPLLLSASFGSKFKRTASWRCAKPRRQKMRAASSQDDRQRTVPFSMNIQRNHIPAHRTFQQHFPDRTDCKDCRGELESMGTKGLKQSETSATVPSSNRLKICLRPCRAAAKRTGTAPTRSALLIERPLLFRLVRQGRLGGKAP